MQLANHDKRVLLLLKSSFSRGGLFADLTCTVLAETHLPVHF